jgi:hypothetical protein
MPSIFSRFGSSCGTMVDKFMSKSGFSSLEQDLKNVKTLMTTPSVSTFTSCEKPESLNEAMECGKQTSNFTAELEDKCKECEDAKLNRIQKWNCKRKNCKSKFTSNESCVTKCSNNPDLLTSTDKLKCYRDCTSGSSGFAAVGDLPLPDSTEFYGNNRFKEAEAMNWSAGESNRLRHERWRKMIPSESNTTLSAPVGTTGTIVPSMISTFTAEGDEVDKQKIKEMEAKTQEYIKKDQSLAWSAGSSNKNRHIRWADKTNKMNQDPTITDDWHNTVSKSRAPSTGPISYQDAILSQPMPVLSPLRGTNQPQGIRAIADANAGYNTQYYDPNYALAAAIPANISSGSLDYTQKATVADKNVPSGQQTAGSTSTFLSKFM